MKTDDLIGMLAAEAGPAPRAAALRRFLPAMLLGLAASAAGALAVIGLVPEALFAHPAWWIKFGYAALLAGFAAVLAVRLGRPAVPVARAWALVGALVLAMATIGIAQFVGAVPSQRALLWLGHSWRTCPLNILGLSLPGLALVFWALRGMAPTRPALAGFAGGLLAGAVGATGYALSCTEVGMPFVATWYSLGIVLTGLLGALLGPRLLRW